MSLKIPDFSKYQVYREKIGEGVFNPSALFNKFLSDTFLGIPLEILRVLVGVATVLSQLLDISSSLGSVQKSIMNISQGVFVALIGGKNGSIANTSVGGFLLVLSLIYLAYHWFNGKGKFWSSLVHLVAVVSTMFFFFGSFTYTNAHNQVKTDMGGQIAFDTVTRISKMAQDKITESLTGYGSPNESSDFFESFVLKPASNLVNLGNVDGKLTNGKGYFDYDKANAKNGDDYVAKVCHYSNGYLQNGGGHFGEEFMGICIETMNLFIYIFPVLLIKLLISIFSLILCLLIMLWPLSAIMSFIPMFRNAFFHVIKVSLGVLIAPTLLTVFLSFLFYLITRIDFAVLSSATGSEVTDLVTSMSILSGPLLMAVLSAIFILKIGLMVMIWKNKSKIISLVTGGSTAGHELMRHTDNLGDNVSQGIQTVKNKVVGGAEVALGATTGNPAIAVDGAQMLAPKTQPQNQDQSTVQEEPQQTSSMPEFGSKPEPVSSKEDQLPSEEPIQEFDLTGKQEGEMFQEHEGLSDLSSTLENTPYNEETAPEYVKELPTSEADIGNNSEDFISSHEETEHTPYLVTEQPYQTTTYEPFENSKEIARNWEEASGILVEARG